MSPWVERGGTLVNVNQVGPTGFTHARVPRFRWASMAACAPRPKDVSSAEPPRSTIRPWSSMCPRWGSGQVRSGNATAPAGDAQLFTNSATMALVLVRCTPARSMRRQDISSAIWLVDPDDALLRLKTFVETDAASARGEPASSAGRPAPSRRSSSRTHA